MTYAENVEILRETRFSRAWEEAKREGRQEGRYIVLLELMEAKFGPVQPKVALSLSRIQNEEKLQQITRAILIAESIEDLPYLS